MDEFFISLQSSEAMYIKLTLSDPPVEYESDQLVVALFILNQVFSDIQDMLWYNFLDSGEILLTMGFIHEP
ncbi:hypothetical protein HanIR_Chr11g0511871 [Helianthus annuus]|nr:hypothetical protein HanIR_Chr11g0511871 [Helianthus annuus]